MLGDSRILKSHPHTCFAKDQAPPQSVNRSLNYRQITPGIYQFTRNSSSPDRKSQAEALAGTPRRIERRDFLRSAVPE